MEMNNEARQGNIIYINECLMVGGFWKKKKKVASHSVASQSETLLQNWIEQTSSEFVSPLASPVFALGPAVLQVPASTFSSLWSLLPSWRHQMLEWGPPTTFSTLNATLQYGCWCVAPRSWSSFIGDLRDDSLWLPIMVCRSWSRENWSCESWSHENWSQEMTPMLLEHKLKILSIF